ncbi:unnamed protein product [Arabis nemorensis]|uniref:Uncharacterized protein n=1 Tax=Arabis nemorensis TaxID=586526 RepID=A0A565C9F9_9BRAS|nr:unnamed protein product [Arabis nemorensis]
MDLCLAISAAGDSIQRRSFSVEAITSPSRHRFVLAPDPDPDPPSFASPLDMLTVISPPDPPDPPDPLDSSQSILHVPATSAPYPGSTTSSFADLVVVSFGVRLFASLFFFSSEMCSFQMGSSREIDLCLSYAQSSLPLDTPLEGWKMSELGMIHNQISFFDHLSPGIRAMSLPRHRYCKDLPPG